MVYPGEISRSSKSTALGTSYVEAVVDPFGVGDTLLVCVPASVADGADVTVMMCAHGHNGSEQTINNSQMVSTRDKALDKGWLVISAYAHGNAWSNDTALADYARIPTWVGETWTLEHLLLHGQSMGALTMANFYSRRLATKIRGMVGIDGAYNLAQAYSQATYKPSIRAAYGIASDDSDYAEKTAGHDATLLEATTFTGRRLFISASPADTAIPKVDHSDVFVAMLGSEPADLEVVEGTGGHVTSPNYFPTSAHAFFDEAILNAVDDPAEPTWPDPIPFPEGVRDVTLYAKTGGEWIQLSVSA
jgi:hypothetical protein